MPLHNKQHIMSTNLHLENYIQHYNLSQGYIQHYNLSQGGPSTLIQWQNKVLSTRAASNQENSWSILE